MTAATHKRRPSKLDYHRSTLCGSIVEVEQSIQSGITALRNGRYRDAEGKFLDALHPVFDPAVQVGCLRLLLRFELLGSRGHS
jgi:hypothetical protein